MVIILPVILILPAPEIFLELRSKLPPNCGEASTTKLLIPLPPAAAAIDADTFAISGKVNTPVASKVPLII